VAIQSMNMSLILFVIALGFELIYLLLFTLTIRGRGFRFWPPPSHRSWQFFVSWLLALVVAANFLFLGLLDFDSSWLPGVWVRAPAAMTLFIIAAVIGIWVYTIFPLRATIGLGKRLITTGPYRYTRNPQYLSDSLSIMGYMIFTNSWMVWVIGALAVLLNILAPFTEEPWLEERFGEAYRQYKNQVPRFIPFVKKSKAV
jgi:protein-S-isoprenylcysteine O-methyltransferase Ste14